MFTIVRNTQRGTGRTEGLRFREGGRGTARCLPAMAFPLPCCFLAGEVFPLGLCRPRYLLVTLVSGELSADGEATILKRFS